MKTTLLLDNNNIVGESDNGKRLELYHIHEDDMLSGNYDTFDEFIFADHEPTFDEVFKAVKDETTHELKRFPTEIYKVYVMGELWQS